MNYPGFPDSWRVNSQVQIDSWQRSLVEMSDVKLWDVDHPYYCNEGNYFAHGCGKHFDRWQDFVEEEGDADLDMNLVFRWDWEAPREDGEFANPIQWVGDENYRDCKLKLFYLGQRKGLYRWVTVDVCRADELLVKAWLQIRWDHLRLLWSPFSDKS